jgi:hypothetical protein
MNLRDYIGGFDNKEPAFGYPVMNFELEEEIVE